MAGVWIAARASTSPFDGKAYQGFAGDTLASALLAAGETLFGRSFKYHRPRGLWAAGVEEPNALISVDRGGGRFTPNLRATQIEIYEGLNAKQPEPLALAQDRFRFDQ
jgi:sarcosine oxidase subunit alpha